VFYRVVSTIHALAAVSAALYTIWFDETFTNPPSGNLAFASSFPGVLAAALTLSYVSFFRLALRRITPLVAPIANLY
jgi:hypothetical protein